MKFIADETSNLNKLDPYYKQLNYLDEKLFD